jgi:hypothetical protein
MTVFVQIVAGIAAGGGLVLWAGPARERRGLRIYAAALVLAALIYVVFAAAGGAGRPGIALEIAGLALFGALAAAGLRFVPALAGLGWLLHAGWDVALHTPGRGEYAPHWYPMLCLGFDLLVGVFVLLTASRAR